MKLIILFTTSLCLVFSKPWGHNCASIVSEDYCTESNRQDCGYVGINEEGCIQKGCCWSPTNTTTNLNVDLYLQGDSPWCFYKSTSPTCRPDYYRKDCGAVGTDKEKCEEDGCCWTPAEQGSSLPWCYYKSTTAPTDACNPDWPRHDCGFYGITKDECEAEGCCWNEKEYESWCFYKHANPPA